MSRRARIPRMNSLREILQHEAPEAHELERQLGLIGFDEARRQLLALLRTGEIPMFAAVAISAVLGMSAAQDELRSIILDRKVPTDGRTGAFLVLLHVDADAPHILEELSEQEAEEFLDAHQAFQLSSILASNEDNVLGRFSRMIDDPDLGFEKGLDEVLAEFARSGEGKQLPTPDSVEWVRDFAGIAMDEFGEVPMTVTGESASEILGVIFPSDVIPDRDATIGDIVPSLRLFFQWMQATGTLLDARGVLDALDATGPTFASLMRDPSKWSAEKKKIVSSRKR